MSPVLILSCLWVVAATGVALLPMRLQFVPGVSLALAAVFSMFRRPLLYLLTKVLGRAG